MGQKHQYSGLTDAEVLESRKKIWCQHFDTTRRTICMGQD